MIFIVKDEHNEQRDRVYESILLCRANLSYHHMQMIAKHVMNIHMSRADQNAEENGDIVGEVPIDKMRRYIAYCKR